jgi:hypothetical protein
MAFLNHAAGSPSTGGNVWLYCEADCAVKDLLSEGTHSASSTLSRRTMFLMLYSYRMKYEGISTLLKGPSIIFSSFLQSQFSSSSMSFRKFFAMRVAALLLSLSLPVAYAQLNTLAIAAVSHNCYLADI